MQGERNPSSRESDSGHWLGRLPRTFAFRTLVSRKLTTPSLHPGHDACQLSPIIWLSTADNSCRPCCDRRRNSRGYPLLHAWSRSTQGGNDQSRRCKSSGFKPAVKSRLPTQPWRRAKPGASCLVRTISDFSQNCPMTLAATISNSHVRAKAATCRPTRRSDSITIGFAIMSAVPVVQSQGRSLTGPGVATFSGRP